MKALSTFAVVFVAMMLLLLVAVCPVHSFSAKPFASHRIRVYSMGSPSFKGQHSGTTTLKETSDEEGREQASNAAKLSLEEKMEKWEATEEEVKKSTLGGVIPGGEKRSDAFDVGLYIAFPFMVIGSLMFALFPFIMDKIDVSSVGPPPTV